MFNLRMAEETARLRSGLGWRHKRTLPASYCSVDSRRTPLQSRLSNAPEKIVPKMPIIRPAAGEAEIRAYSEVMTQSLSFPRLEEYDWIARIGPEGVRVIDLNGRIVGGAVLIRFGTWFGGRSVPTIGVSAVGVAADARGGGIGVHLVKRLLEECHETGSPVSTLYPATQPVYARPGFAQAGWRIQYKLPTTEASGGDRSLLLRPMTPDDHPAVQELYRERAQASNGQLDRIPWNWTRVLDSRFGTTYKYVIVNDGRIEGYFTHLHKRDPVEAFRYDLDVLDLCFATPAAGRRIISFFADHRSVCRHAYWMGAPVDPLNYLIPDQRAETCFRFNWMLRLVDVRAALRARGYSPLIRTELHLDVEDDVFPRNSGRFVVEIADGCGFTRDGGRGEMKIDVRGLASLYTGYSTAQELAQAGMLSGSPEALAAATAVFAGPTPWLADMF